MVFVHNKMVNLDETDITKLINNAKGYDPLKEDPEFKVNIQVLYSKLNNSGIV
jgi:hypothetical protein